MCMGNLSSKAPRIGGPSETPTDHGAGERPEIRRHQPGVATPARRVLAGRAGMFAEVPSRSTFGGSFPAVIPSITLIGRKGKGILTAIGAGDGIVRRRLRQWCRRRAEFYPCG